MALVESILQFEGDIQRELIETVEGDHSQVEAYVRYCQTLLTIASRVRESGPRADDLTEAVSSALDLYRCLGIPFPGGEASRRTREDQIRARFVLYCDILKEGDPNNGLREALIKQFGGLEAYMRRLTTLHEAEDKHLAALNSECPDSEAEVLTQHHELKRNIGVRKIEELFGDSVSV